MRRNDTMEVGDAGELEASRLLTAAGWSVENLNATSRNAPIHDLIATKAGKSIKVSVKVSRAANRNLSLGAYHMFAQLRDDDFVIAFVPAAKGLEVGFPSRSYEVWVVPGHARHDALNAHLAYYGGDEERARSHRVMIKDKVDTPGGRSTSGAAFKKWQSLYRDAWNLLA